MLLAKLAADRLKEGGQHHRAQRMVADASRLRPPPSVLTWLRGQPPSEAITGEPKFTSHCGRESNCKCRRDTVKRAGGCQSQHRSCALLATLRRLPGHAEEVLACVAWSQFSVKRSCVIAGILAKVERDPSRLAAQLLSSAPVNTLRALQRAHSAAEAPSATGGGAQTVSQPGPQGTADQAAEDELLFVMEKGGDPQAASLWAEGADGAASGSEDDIAALRDDADAGDSSEGGGDST